MALAQPTIASSFALVVCSILSLTGAERPIRNPEHDRRPFRHHLRLEERRLARNVSFLNVDSGPLPLAAGFPGTGGGILPRFEAPHLAPRHNPGKDGQAKPKKTLPSVPVDSVPRDVSEARDDVEEEDTKPGGPPRHMNLFVTKAENLPKLGTPNATEINPYFIVKLGDHSFWGPALMDVDSRMVSWQYEHKIFYDGEPFLRFDVMESELNFDEFIGLGTIDMEMASKHEKKKYAVPLKNDVGADVGTIHIMIEWLSDESGETAHGGVCHDKTPGTCWKLECRADRGPTECIDHKCLCAEGFCWREVPSGFSCMPLCGQVEANSSTQDKIKHAYSKLSPKYKHNNRKLRARGLQQLGEVGLPAANYVNVVVDHMDEGHDVGMKVKILGAKFGISAKLTDVLGAGITSVKLITDMVIGEQGAKVLAGLLLSNVLGLTCVINPIACLAVGLTAKVVAKFVSAVAYNVIKKKLTAVKDRIVEEMVEIRKQAVFAVGRFGDCGSPYASSVALRFTDENALIRLEALSTIERFGDQGAPYAADVAILLNDPVYQVRSRAELVLSSLGDAGKATAAKELAEFLKSGDPIHQVLAARTLGMMGKPGALYAEELANLIDLNEAAKEVSPNHAALEALARIGRHIPVGKARYVMAETPKTWNSAKASCEENGMLLATPKDNEENEQIGEVCRIDTGSEVCWIGGQNPSGDLTEWISEITTGYANWASGEPSSDDEKCIGVVASGAQLGKWDDRGCDQAYNFVCEKASTSAATPEARIAITTKLRHVIKNDKDSPAQGFAAFALRFMEEGHAEIKEVFPEFPEGVHSGVMERVGHLSDEVELEHALTRASVAEAKVKELEEQPPCDKPSLAANK